MVSFHAASDTLSPPPERPPLAGGRPGAISATGERVGPVAEGDGR